MGKEKYPLKVVEIRKIFKLDENPQTTKLFVKDMINSPIYGAWSCVKTDRNFRELDKLEIGQTWERWGSPNLTRVN